MIANVIYQQNNFKNTANETNTKIHKIITSYTINKRKLKW